MSGTNYEFKEGDIVEFEIVGDLPRWNFKKDKLSQFQLNNQVTYQTGKIVSIDTDTFRVRWLIDDGEYETWIFPLSNHPGYPGPVSGFPKLVSSIEESKEELDIKTFWF